MLNCICTTQPSILWWSVRVLGVRQTLQRFFLDGERRYLLELDDTTGVLPVMLAHETYLRYENELKPAVRF
jgi:hypothetical protein